MSGVGKGIATASIGRIIQAKGYHVNPIKVDPYLNVDAGTMNPTEHGETFVLNSGLETDQDMGNYERFMGIDLSADDYMTSGMVYKHVIDRERALAYGGKCVEAIPHVTGEIIRRIQKAAENNGSEVTIVEIGGTIGDYQNILFMEAARMLKIKNPQNVIFIMVSYLPIPGTLGEMKTRPTQNAVRQYMPIHPGCAAWPCRWRCSPRLQTRGSAVHQQVATLGAKTLASDPSLRSGQERRATLSTRHWLLSPPFHSPTLVSYSQTEHEEAVERIHASYREAGDRQGDGE